MQKRFMERAIELAVKNVDSGGGPFGSVIVCGHKIVGEGVNRVTATNDPTAHAEVVAIRNACTRLKSFELSHCEIYTSCEPCPMCLGAIYWARLRAVHFATTAHDAAEAGFDDSTFYGEMRLPAEKRSLPMKQLMRKEGLAAFKAWATKANKIEY